VFRTVCKRCLRELGPEFTPFCDCGGIADVEYDLASARLHDSSNPYRRFRDLLPVRDEGLLPGHASFSPTVHATRLGRELGMPWLYLKDETGLPTGTTKDRMAAVALPYLYEGGVRGFATSSTGNSSSAYAHAITRLPGLAMYLFTAEQFRERVDVPAAAEVVNFTLRDATFVEAFDAARDFAEEHGLVPERGFFNPGRREGLKLAWLEAADQVPRPIDWYVQAVSSAMGVYGVYKGAKELRELGHSERLPRLLCVQQETCAPMVAAWDEGSETIRPEHVVERPTGIAQAILRGNPSRAYPHVREIVIESGGTFVAVSEAQIREAKRKVEELEGISPCFAAAAALAGLAKLGSENGLDPGDTVLVNLTGGDRPPCEPTYEARWLRRSDSGWVPEAEYTAWTRV
jgi:threonine synthase